jgi:3-oxoadipate enol-lactonase
MPMVSAAGRDFEVTQQGAGRDLVLLHSLLTDATVFDEVAAVLARDRRLTMPNLPGFGASSAGGPRIEDYADQVAALLDALALPPTTDLVAMSFGGFVGTALAARRGARFNQLVLVDTAAAFPEAAKTPLRAMARRALDEGMDAVVDIAIRRMFTDAYIATHPDVVTARAAVLRRARPACFATACTALAELDLRGALGAIANRTLVVVGALDTTTPPALARALAAGIRDAALVEIADCAHCPPLEKPAEFVNVLTGFLR